MRNKINEGARAPKGRTENESNQQGKDLAEGNKEIEFGDVRVKEIKKREFMPLLFEYNPVKYLPRINKKFYAADYRGEQIGGMSLGWGTRPKHTIQKLFPSLDTKDYLEVGRLCISSDTPRNFDSFVMKQWFNKIQEDYPDVKVIFSWSNGMLGKPGYVYQASNFHYGGYIWTDGYFTDSGEFVHPRQTNRIKGRPSWEQMQELGWKHYRGRQFRYIFFLCSKGEQKRLLRESPFDWTKTKYPKHEDLAWKVKTEEGWVKASQPYYDPWHFSYNKKKGQRLEKYRRQKRTLLSKYFGGDIYAETP